MSYKDWRDLWSELHVEREYEHVLNEWEEKTQKEDWDSLSGFDWTLVLRDKPELSRYCKWEKLREYDWKWLIKVRPEFTNHYKAWKLMKR